jgi:hypothetical protein
MNPFGNTRWSGVLKLHVAFQATPPVQYPFQYILYSCTMPKRQAVVIFPEVNYEIVYSDGKCKKRELEAIHQLSQNRYTCIDHAYSMITKYKQLNWKLAVSNLGRRISTDLVIYS